MRKFVFVNRFYRPDLSATSQILTNLTLALDLPNSEIHIVTSRQLYENNKVTLPPEDYLDNIHIHRAWTTRFGRAQLLGRSLDYLSFYFTAFALLLRLVRNGDIVVAKTDPPLISVIAAITVKLKNGRLINWIQDVYPEVAGELGVKGFTGLKYTFIKFVRNWSLKTAESNVVLGNIMAKRINSEINKPESTCVIHNRIIGKNLIPINQKDNSLREEWGLANKFVVGYSGNLGRAHDYQTILEAAIRLQEKTDIVFLFIGGGANYELLKQGIKARGLSNVQFKPYQGSNTLALSLSVPDVHLISLKPALEGLIVPSKIYGIMAVGRPVIFVGDRDGEIACIVNEGDCGMTVPIGDTVALADAIEDYVKDESRRHSQAKNSRIIFERNFCTEKIDMQWRELLGQFAEVPTAAGKISH